MEDNIQSSTASITASCIAFKKENFWRIGGGTFILYPQKKLLEKHSLGLLEN